MAESAKQVLVMEGDLHKALENNRFSLPICELVSILVRVNFARVAS